jgi:hypothetical protein
MMKRVFLCILMCGLFTITAFPQDPIVKFNTKYYTPGVDALPEYGDIDNVFFENFTDSFKVTIAMFNFKNNGPNDAYMIEPGHGQKQLLISGNILAFFVVDTTGNVKDLLFSNSDNKPVEEELIRLFGLLGKFKPAQVDGKPVPFQLVVPFKYSIEGTKFFIGNKPVQYEIGGKKKKKN